jgi:hypothetical protein
MNNKSVRGFMNWKRNLLASICAAISAAVSAYLLQYIVYNTLDGVVAFEFMPALIVCCVLIIPFSFLLGPIIIEKYDDLSSLLNVATVTIIGVSSGVLLGLISFFLLVFHYSSQLPDD